MAATFLAALLFSVSIGIIVGIVLNLFFVLHRNARPKITCELFEIADEKVLVLSPFQNLYFPAADALLKKISECAQKHKEAGTIIVINGQLVKRVDSSVAETFITFFRLTNKLSAKLVFWNWEPHPRAILIHAEPRFEFLFRDSENLETLLLQMDVEVPMDLTARPFYNR